jgi:hypothetical protein
LNKFNESAAEEKEEQKEKAVPPSQPPPPLKTLQNILYNRIMQKKEEIHESHNRAYTDNL